MQLKTEFMISYRTNHILRYFRTYFYLLFFHLIVHFSSAQVGYVSVDQSLYYMNFDTKVHAHVMDFPFNLSDLTIEGKNNLHGIGIIDFHPYLVNIDLTDTSYTLKTLRGGDDLAFVNDSMVYLTNNITIQLHNTNSKEYMDLDVDHQGEYKALAFDQKANRLFALQYVDPMGGRDQFLTFENNEIIFRTEFQGIDNFRSMDLAPDGNLYVMDLWELYQIDKTNGSFIKKIINLEDYFDGYYMNVALVEPSLNPNQLWTTDRQLDLGTIPMGKTIKRRFLVENFSDQPWTFSGFQAPESLGVSFSEPIGAEISDYLEVTISMKKEEMGYSSEEISLFWENSREFRMKLEAQVMAYEKAVQDHIYLSLRSGEIITLDADYNFFSASNTGLFNIKHLSVDSSGYIHGTQGGDIYLIDPKTGTVLKEFSEEERKFGSVFFGDNRTYYWEDVECWQSPQVWTGIDYELSYQFQNNGDDGICVTSAVLKEGTQEFYFLSGMEKLYRLDLSAEQPRPELLLEYNSLTNLHFTENGRLRAQGTWDNQHEIYEISEDFSTVRRIRNSKYLTDLEITSLTALPLSALVVLHSPTDEQKNQPGIYPNPFGESFVLEDPLHQIVSLGLYALTGQLIADLPLTEDSTHTYEIDQNLEAGIYLLKIAMKDGSTDVVKVIHNPH